MAVVPHPHPQDTSSHAFLPPPSRPTLHLPLLPLRAEQVSEKAQCRCASVVRIGQVASSSLRMYVSRFADAGIQVSDCPTAHVLNCLGVKPPNLALALALFYSTHNPTLSLLLTPQTLSLSLSHVPFLISHLPDTRIYTPPHSRHHS
jgi:hypothetical protein